MAVCWTEWYKKQLKMHVNVAPSYAGAKREEEDGENAIFALPSSACKRYILPRNNGCTRCKMTRRT